MDSQPWIDLDREAWTRFSPRAAFRTHDKEARIRCVSGTAHAIRGRGAHANRKTWGSRVFGASRFLFLQIEPLLSDTAGYCSHRHQK